MTTQTLIYTEQDHKGQVQIVHAADCAEGKRAHAFASGHGHGDQANWDKYTVASREELLSNLRGIYGAEEVDEYIIPQVKWEPCVKVK
jgi:hypothetical protein